MQRLIGVLARMTGGRGVENRSEQTSNDPVRQALNETGFDLIPIDASDITILNEGGGSFLLAYQLDKGSRAPITHQWGVELRFKQAGLSLDEGLAKLRDAGIPFVETN